MTMGHYLRSMRQLTDQWTPSNFRDERRQRLYLKDIDCPPEWHDYLRKIIPPGLFYFNENVEEHSARSDDLFMEEHVAASAGDLMSSLPEEMRAQNLMCYIGHEGTYTPAHREMCATLGHNIMVEASGDENGEKPGSSIWFMTETKDRQVVREYFLSMLGHDVEIEKHFAQINAWKKATFPVYIVEQKVGDFILIPPLAPHQVWNRGTRTMKVAWNRTTVETLDFALHEALPRARLVCRDEQYKNKAIIYFTLKKYYEQLQSTTESQMSLLIGDDLGRDSVRLVQLKKEFKKLLQLFTEILVDEMFASKEKNVEMITFDSCITCSYCRCNIFNRFLTCQHCVRELIGGDQDTYDVCMECYAMGRSCLCVSGLSWCEQWDWSELVDNYDLWRGMVIYNDGYVDMNLSPPPLEVARMKIGRKSLAQICQEQLRRRPFNDVSKPGKNPDPEPSEPEIDEQGKAKKPKRKKKKGDTYKCHTCIHKDYTYRLAFCSNPGCNLAYCFGVLYRAFDMMPQEILQAERWQCPKCQGICNCGACRRAGNTDPYEPKNTYIGHDTRAIADDRSKEFLVDFRVHNLNWLKAAGDESRNHNSKRIQRLRQQADAEKEKDQGDVGTLANGGSAPNENASHSNEFGDQGPAYDVNEAVSYENDLSGLQQAPQNGASEVNDLNMLPDADASLYPETSYPDPLSGERRLGMGYYEQDDSPDKILFNPYEEPTAEDLFDEEAEYVRRSLRAAKRRARQEDYDDPDFVVRRSHKKKKVERGSQPDTLQNLDPALLNQDVTMADAPLHPQQEVPIQQDYDGQSEQDEQDEELVDYGRPFDPNVPTLRHARPKISYADVEDIEEFNEVIPVKPKKPTPAPQPEPPGSVEPSADPLDLAAVAIHAITSTSEAEATPAGPGRKRGRPRRSGPEHPRRSPETTTAELSTPQTGPSKRRGRPPRSSLGVNTVGDHEDEEEVHNAAIDELEKQLSQDLEEGEKSLGPTPKRRGRPPKKAAVPVAEKSTPARVTRSNNAIDPTPVSSERFMSMAERMALKGKKVRIAKRKSDEDVAGPHENSADTVETTAASKADMPAPEEPSAATQFSVAEAPMDKPVAESTNDFSDEPVTSRPASITPAPTSQASSLPPRQLSVSSSAPVTSKKLSSVLVDREYESREPSPVPLPPKPAGPTIVRLGDSDEENDSVYGYGSESDSISSGSSTGDNEDEGIPAVTEPKPVTTPTLRGHMAKRGGGRGRGRGRPRGRGRAF